MVILLTQVWIANYSLAMDAGQLVWVCAEGGGSVVVILLGTSQLVWVCADGSGPAVVILLESWLWIVCRHVFISLSFVSFSWFPRYAYPCGLRFLMFCPGYGTLCALSAIEKGHPILKWLLPPSIKMKWEVIRSFFNVGMVLLGSFIIVISLVGLSGSS